MKSCHFSHPIYLLSPKKTCATKTISLSQDKKENFRDRNGHQVLFYCIGEPSAPYNCTVYNITAVSLQVSCLQGYDGGLPQTFSMLVQQTKTDRLVFNATEQWSSNFSVHSLEPGMAYELHVWSQNSKGRSNSVILMAETYDNPIKM